MSRRAAAGAVAIFGVGLALGAPRAARADDRPRIAAQISLDDDARHVLAIGPSGQVYAADGHGAWRRTAAGGVAGDVAVASRRGDAVLVGDGRAVFERRGETWVALHPSRRGRAVLARGRRPIAAIGRTVIDLDHPDQPLGDAPDDVTAVAAGARVVIATARGLYDLDHRHARRLNAPPGAILVGDGWATSAAGALDLRRDRTVPWPAGRTVQVAIGAGDSLTAVAAGPDHLDLLVVRGARLELVASPLPPTTQVTAIFVDGAGRVALGTRDGQVAIRAGATWTVAVVADALPAPRPGAGPAVSR